MAGKKNLCAMIPEDLYAKVTQEKMRSARRWANTWSNY